MDKLFEEIIRIVFCVLIGITIFIPILIAEKFYKEQLRRQMSESCYVMRGSKKAFWYCAVSTFGFYIFTILTIFAYESISDLYIVLLFLLFTLSAMYATIYCLLWNVVVDRNSLTIYSPGFSLKKIKMYDISEIKWKKHRIVGYVNGKRFFDIDDDTSNFDMLYRDLYRIGKINPTQIRENFSVTYDKQTIILAGIGVVFLGGLLIVSIVLVGGELGTIYYILSVFLPRLCYMRLLSLCCGK